MTDKPIEAQTRAREALILGKPPRLQRVEPEQFTDAVIVSAFEALARERD